MDRGLTDDGYVAPMYATADPKANVYVRTYVVRTYVRREQTFYLSNINTYVRTTLIRTYVRTI